MSSLLVVCRGESIIFHSLIAVFDRTQHVRDNAVVDDGRCIMCGSSYGLVILPSSCPQ